MANYLSDLPLVCVIWADAQGDATTEHNREEIRREFHKAPVFATFGLLVQDDEEGITLAMEQIPPVTGKSHRGLSLIPRGMITEVISLGRPKRQPAKRRTVPPSTTPEPS